MLIVVLPLVLWQQRLLAANRFVTVTGKATQLVALGRWRWPSFWPLALLGAFTTVVPGICLILGTFMNIFCRFDMARVWTGEHWSEVLSDPLSLRALWNTTVMEGAAAIFGMFWFSLVAYVSVRTRYPGRNKLLDFVMAAGEPARRDPQPRLALDVPHREAAAAVLRHDCRADRGRADQRGDDEHADHQEQHGDRRRVEEVAQENRSGRAATYRQIMLLLLAPVLVTAALYIFALRRAMSQPSS